MKQKIIISLGGSMIVPGGINIKYLKDFRSLILKHTRTKQFIIVTGGGKTAREYIQAATKVHRIPQEDKDWLGIHTTRLNAHLLRTIFKEQAFSRVLKDPRQRIKTKKPIIIAGGWKPGCTTDYDAVLLAKYNNAKTVINITNIDYLYTKDPNKNKNAKKILQTDWNTLIKIVGTKHKPGINAPFGPRAAGLAKKLGLTLVLLGSSTANLDKYLKHKKFKGSVISNTQ